MNQAEQNYVHGTAARKLDYDVYEENHVLKQKKKHKTNNKFKLKLLCSILVVFSLVFLLVYRYAVITELSYNIDKTSQNLSKIQNENSILEVDIENATDLNKIQELAENKLGMHKPDKYQVVYVNVPKSDFAVVSEDYSKNAKASNLFGMLAEKVGKLSHLIN